MVEASRDPTADTNRVVFLQDFQIVDVPYGDVVDVLRRDPRPLFATALEDARIEGEHLRGRVCPANWPVVLAKTVELRAESPRILPDVAVVPFTWRAATGSSLFPTFDADLEITAFGTWQTRLTVLGRYQPPGGSLGWHLDRLVLRNVAESTVRTFLGALCRGIETSVRQAHTTSHEAHRDV
ncbi:MAG: hypothetical protein K6T28_08275 [Acidothermus sp.]|nr:hypothetical protein [Acidothermus sp.]